MKINQPEILEIFQQIKKQDADIYEKLCSVIRGLDKKEVEKLFEEYEQNKHNPDFVSPCITKTGFGKVRYLGISRNTLEADWVGYGRYYGMYQKIYVNLKAKEQNNSDEKPLLCEITEGWNSFEDYSEACSIKVYVESQEPVDEM